MPKGAPSPGVDDHRHDGWLDEKRADQGTTHLMYWPQK
jgi:hypothetical protein